MRAPFKFSPLPSTLAAAGLFATALLLARMGLPEFSHLQHPLALRGAGGLPGALLFNAGAFLLPGLGLLLAAQGLRPWLDGRGWPARIGLTLAQLSILAFAAQGALPLDARDLDGDASRLHALAWMLWWISFVPAALLLAQCLRRERGLALASVAAGLLLPLLAVLLPLGSWAPLAQRLAFALWFGWWLLLAWRLGRPPATGTAQRGGSL